MGGQAMILLDSITRLARAYNLTVPPSVDDVVLEFTDDAP